MRPFESYKNDYLIGYLLDLNQELGHAPRGIDLDRADGPGSDTYRRHFGTVGNALAQARLEPIPSQGLTKEQLFEKIREAKKILGHRPSLREMDELPGFPCSSVYVERIGWKNALRMSGADADLKPRNFISKEKCLQDVRDAAKKRGRTPTYWEMDAMKEYTNPRTIADKFGSWKNALKEAGLPEFKKGYSDEELFAEMAKVRNLIGHMPSFEEMWHSNGPAPTTYKNHFGSWRRAKEEFDLYDRPSMLLKLCSERGLNYMNVRQMVSDLARFGKVDEFTGGPNRKENFEGMKFVQEYLRPLCRRSCLSADGKAVLNFDRNESMYVLKLV